MVIFYKKADTRIQQMTFMILFVFIFFSIVGLLFASFYSKDIKSSYENKQRDLAIASLETIANMPELSCDGQRSACLDEDKLMVFAENADDYEDFWPVSYIKVRKIYPKSATESRCPSANCTYFEIYNSQNQTNVEGQDLFVSICKKINSFGRSYDECYIGKLDVGVKLKKI